MREDFLGFTFQDNSTNIYHSKRDLGIIRTSDSDRYKDTLIPEINDKTVEIPGIDGVYFYGSNFKERQFDISFAFDSLTEKQLRKLREVFGYQHTGLLSFDEQPYKTYFVKVAAPPELNYVCFDEQKKTTGEERDGVRVARRDVLPPYVDEETGETIYPIDVVKERVTPYVYSDETERIYKGEGTINFVAYYPFARQTYKYLDVYRNQTDSDNNPIYTNVDDWAEASRLKDQSWFEENEIDSFANLNGSGDLLVYNAGDRPTGFRIYVPLTDVSDMNLSLTRIAADGTTQENLTITGLNGAQGDEGLQINTVNGLIEGAYISQISQDTNANILTTGTLYNRYATGEFFKIPPGEGIQTIRITSNLGNKLANCEIFYNYLYF